MNFEIRINRSSIRLFCFHFRAYLITYKERKDKGKDQNISGLESIQRRTWDKKNQRS